MDWTKSNALKRNLGGTSQHVKTVGKDFFSRHLNGAPRRLADIGCFSGRNLPPLIALAGPAGQVFGFDHPEAEPWVTRAREEFPRVEFTLATLQRLPIADGALHGALCWRVLHNLPSQTELAEATAEIRRTLADGAPFLVAVRGLGKGGPTPELRETDNGAGGTRRDLYFSREACERTFATAGFEVQSIDRVVEEATVDGHPVANSYWAAHCVRR